jgi:hypothetical protein
MSNHQELVREFLEKKALENPEEYDRVCSKYPVVSARRIAAIHRREATVGLLGLLPSRINLSTAKQYDMESEIEEQGDN